MRQQFLPDPIDHIDFHQNLSSNCSELERLIFTGGYAPSVTRRLLQEKSRGLCRQLVIPTLRDALVLQCLSDAMYRYIRDKEPTKRAFFEPSDHHFSNTKGLFGRSDYGSFRAWLNFQKEIFHFSRTRAYMVITDVANYYDSIVYQHLRHVVSDVAPTVREPVLDMLIFVLSGLLWQPDYMPRVEVGLPQLNLDAPRILAHCFLYELDQYLDTLTSVDFVRFMDDVDVGVDDLAAARQVLKCMDLVLHTRHVRLNSGKTQILTRKDALRHFRVRENIFVDLLEERIEAKVAAGISVASERAWIAKTISRRMRRKLFDDGNGDKILKRLLGVARRIGADIADDVIYEILLRRPSCRVAAFTSIASRPMTNARARLLLTVARDRQIVDDATFVNLSQYTVETRIDSKWRIAGLLSSLAASMPSGFFGLYARIWLASRYDTRPALFRLLRDSLPEWRTDPWLGRLVGGMYPLFIRSRSEGRFRSLVRTSGNIEANTVYDFHDDLRRDLSAFNKTFAFIRAPNSSKATGIAHSKFLLLLSALANSSAPLTRLQELVNRHSQVWSDVFYREAAARVSRVPIPTTVAPATPVP